MASFKPYRSCACALLAGLALFSFGPSLADAQQQPSGFAVERFYQSAPGGGWFIMGSAAGRRIGVSSYSEGCGH